MPYVLKPNELFARDPNNNHGYLPQNVIATQTADEQVALVEAAGASTIAAVRQAVNDSAEAVNGIQAHRDAMIESITSALNRGTDTTLSLPTVPADAKATGDELNSLKSAFDENRTAVSGLLSDEATLLSGSLTDKSATSSGVTYTLVGNVVTAVGTVEGSSSFTMLGSTSSAPPAWMVGGKKYVLNIANNTPAEIRLQAKTTTMTSIYTFVAFKESGSYIITIPDNITVFRLLLNMTVGQTANGTITIEISNAIPSKDLADDISELQEAIAEIPTIVADYLELATDNCPAIPDNTDLDTYTTPGTYKITNNTHAGTMTNIPIKISGKLLVMSLSQTARSYQIYSAANSACSMYVRFYNGSTWSDWQKIAYYRAGYVLYASGSFAGGLATESLDIYVPVTTGYIKYVMYHYINTDIAENYNVWRIYHAYHVDDLADTNLLDISISGEWECALHLEGRSDFSGGSTHGDEIMQDDIVVLRNGKPVNLSSLTSLTTFSNLTLVRTSKLYDPNIPADPSTPKTVIADHGVQYNFSAEDHNLTINQSVIWRVTDTLTNCFLCMFLPSKNVIDRAVANSDFKTMVLPSSTSEPLTTITKSKATAVTMWDTGTGVSAEISVPTYPTGLTGGDQISISDNSGKNYNKLYFKICGGGTCSPGEMWKSTSVYKIDYN